MEKRLISLPASQVQHQDWQIELNAQITELRERATDLQTKIESLKCHTRRSEKSTDTEPESKNGIEAIATLPEDSFYLVSQFLNTADWSISSAVSRAWCKKLYAQPLPHALLFLSKETEPVAFRVECPTPTLSEFYCAKRQALSSGGFFFESKYST